MLSGGSHSSARVEDIRPVVEPSPGDPEWLPVRHHFGITSFGVNVWRARAAGDLAIEEHDELPRPNDTANHEELYLVLSGSARFDLGGEELVAEPGTLVHVGDPAVVRRAVALEGGTTILAIGAPLGSYEISPWELKYVRAPGRS